MWWGRRIRDHIAINGTAIVFAASSARQRIVSTGAAGVCTACAASFELSSFFRWEGDVMPACEIHLCVHAGDATGNDEDHV